MSSSIGYGAAAIRAGDIKYQQSLINLVKDAAKEPEAAKTDRPAPRHPDHVGKKLDVKA